MQIKTKLIQSASHNPYENLALEEYLLGQVEDREIILYLWQNENTIVIGKNQNPWKECRVSVAQRDNISIARRLSGGGAVFHDLGNLNFTFIMKESLYNLEKQLEVILDAVQSLGIKAVFTGKNDITVDGKKFSGNAFYFSQEATYHHGTILVNTDKTALGNYLKVTKEKLISKGIDSARSRVVNLIELNPAVTVEKVSQALISSFEGVYGSSVETMICPEGHLLKEALAKNMSWQWIFGQSPKFHIQLERHFDFGSLEFLFFLKSSVIERVTIYSDAVLMDVLDEIREVLIGVPFDISSINKRLSSIKVKTKGEQDMIGQIQNWLKNKAL